MNRSTPLSADARRLLELGSDVEPPTAEQDERMARALAPLFRTGRPGPFTLEGAGAPTRASAPAAGSALGGAELRTAGADRRTAHGSSNDTIRGTAHEHERSGIRVRTAARATARLLEPLRLPEPLRGLRDAKIWLTLGALAATASASFWLGRLSTPAELEPARPASAELASAELVSAGLVPPIALGAPSLVELPAEPAPALASASLAPSRMGSSDGALSSLAPPVPDAASSARAALPRDMRPGEASSHDNPGLRRGDARAHRSLGLAAEIEQLARAEAALRQGRAARALLVLEQRSVQHLLEQAAALRAIAECELGVVGAALSARDVLERWPASAFQPRIARACQP